MEDGSDFNDFTDSSSTPVFVFLLSQGRFRFLQLRIWSFPYTLVSASGFFSCSSDFSCVSYCFKIIEYIVYFFKIKAGILYAHAENRMAWKSILSGG